MHAILKFTLPEEKAEFEYALKGPNAYVVLESLYQHLRGKIKYQELSDDAYTAYQDSMDTLSNLMVEHEVNLW